MQKQKAFKIGETTAVSLPSGSIKLISDDGYEFEYVTVEMNKEKGDWVFLVKPILIKKEKVDKNDTNDNESNIESIF